MLCSLSRIFSEVPEERIGVRLRLRSKNVSLGWQRDEPCPCGVHFFLESTFIDQNNPKRQTADPHWGSPKLDLSLRCPTYWYNNMVTTK